jgi:hypothetical protein
VELKAKKKETAKETKRARKQESENKPECEKASED